MRNAISLIRRLAASPFAWLAVYVCIITVAAGFMLPYDRVSAQHNQRNPYPWRAWPEYVSGPPSEDLVVVIGNSQAVARELESPDQLYTAQLKKRLQPHGLALENWSLEGIRLAEIELLTLKAVQRRARLVTVVVAAPNIGRQSSVQLGSGASDIDLLAGEPGLWHQLRHTLVFANARLKEVTDRFFLRNLDMVRMRMVLRDWLATQVDRRSHSLLFGVRVNPENYWRHHELPPPQATIPTINPTSSSPDFWEQQFMAVQYPSLQSWTDRLLKRLAGTETELLWVWMPTPHEDPRLLMDEGAQPFYQQFCELMRSRGLACENLSRLLPDNTFLPAYNRTHLKPHGHQTLAEALLPLIVDAVH